MNDIRAAFHAFPKSKFPLRMMMFDPTGDLVFDSGEITGFAAIPVPGLGSGSVRYSVTTFADGDVLFNDDPTCSGTVDYSHNDLDVLGRLLHFIQLVQEAGRWFVEESSKIADEVEGGDLREYFERQAEIGEHFLEGAEVTRKMLESASNEESR